MRGFRGRMKAGVGWTTRRGFLRACAGAAGLAGLAGAPWVVRGAAPAAAKEEEQAEFKLTLVSVGDG